MKTGSTVKWTLIFKEQPDTRPEGRELPKIQLTLPCFLLSLPASKKNYCCNLIGLHRRRGIDGPPKCLLRRCSSLNDQSEDILLK